MTKDVLNRLKLWSRSRSRSVRILNVSCDVSGRSLWVLPQSSVLLLTLLSERGSPRTATAAPPPLPRCLLPPGRLVQGHELGPVQDVVPVSGPAPGLAAGHDGGLEVVLVPCERCRTAGL